MPKNNRYALMRIKILREQSAHRISLVMPLWVKSRHVQCKAGCPLSANSGHSQVASIGRKQKTGSGRYDGAVLPRIHKPHRLQQLYSAVHAPAYWLYAPPCSSGPTASSFERILLASLGQRDALYSMQPKSQVRRVFGQRVTVALDNRQPRCL